MSPPGQPGTGAVKSAATGSQPMLILDFSQKASSHAVPQQPSSLRERIARWLDQPL